MEYNKLTEAEMEMMLDEGRRMMMFQIEAMKQNAKVMFARKQALVSEGFTEQEALEIIKARGTEM